MQLRTMTSSSWELSPWTSDEWFPVSLPTKTLWHARSFHVSPLSHSIVIPHRAGCRSTSSRLRRSTEATRTLASSVHQTSSWSEYHHHQFNQQRQHYHNDCHHCTVGSRKRQAVSLNVRLIPQQIRSAFFYTGRTTP